MAVTVQPINLPFHADAAPRRARPGQLVISYHSYGPPGNILRLKESYVAPFYTMDRQGFSGFSELATDPEAFADEIARMPLDEASAFVTGLRHDLIAHNISKYPQGGAPDPALPKPYIFMPLQTLHDPVAQVERLDTFDVLSAAAAIAAATGRALVIKRHPWCDSDQVAQALADLAAQNTHVHLSDASIHPLIAGASCVLGANSGVLFEALIHGAHVVSYGGSDFESVTTPVARLEDLAAAIAAPPVDAAARDRFLCWYLTQYCVRADDVDAIQARISAALNEVGTGRSKSVFWYRVRLKSYAFAEEKRRARLLASKTRRPSPLAGIWHRGPGFLFNELRAMLNQLH